MTRMRRNATWGGHLEIQACSMLYQVNITIHQLNQPRWDLSFPGLAVKTIHFSYHQGQHYSSVRMIGDRGVGAPQQIVVQSKVSKPLSKSEYREPEIVVPREEELIIMDHTGCNNIEFIRQVLMEHYSDIDASVDFIYMIGPENIEFQKEYLEKPYDPSNQKPTENPTQSKEYKKKQPQNKNNNYTKPENEKENQQNKIEIIKSKHNIIHETNKQRKERLRAEKFAAEVPPQIPVPPVVTPASTEEVADPVAPIIMDLGSVQI